MGWTTPIQWCDSTCNVVMGCEGCELYVPGLGGPCYTGNEHQLIGRSQNNSGYAPDFFTPTLFKGRASAFAQHRGADLRGKARPEKPWLDGMPRLIFVSDMGDALSRGKFIHSEDVETTAWRADRNGRLRPAARRAPPERVVTPSTSEDGVPFEFLRSELIEPARSPGGRRHEWLWLTKQPQRMAAFSQWLLERRERWPTNVWAGTSVTGRGTLWRVEALARVGSEDTLRFISAEPLFHQVSLRSALEAHPGRWWVISGGESLSRGGVREGQRA